MAIVKKLASSVIKGQMPVEIYEITEGFAVGYGEEWREYTTMKEAVNGYNQCQLHAETCAGWHEG